VFLSADVTVWSTCTSGNCGVAECTITVVVSADPAISANSSDAPLTVAANDVDGEGLPAEAADDRAAAVAAWDTSTTCDRAAAGSSP
jgi:hypothetical protein